MVSTAGKVRSVAEDLQLSEDKVAAVLYSYLCYCLEEALIDGKTRTIFGTLTINNENRLSLETDKGGLIELLDKKDLKLIRKIAENGPDTSIFGHL